MSRNLGSHLRNPNLIVRTTGEEHHYVKPPPYLVERIGQILVSQSRHFPSLDVQIPPPYSTYYVTRSTNSSNHFVLLDFSFPLPIRNLPPTISSRWNRARRTFPHFRRTSLSMAPRIPDVEKRDPSIPPPIIRRSSRTSSFLRTTTTWRRRSRGRCRVRHLTPPCGAGLLWQPIGLLVELIDSSTFSTSRIARQLQYFGILRTRKGARKRGREEKRKKERKKEEGETQRSRRILRSRGGRGGARAPVTSRSTPRSQRHADATVPHLQLTRDAARRVCASLAPAHRILTPLRAPGTLGQLVTLLPSLCLVYSGRARFLFHPSSVLPLALFALLVALDNNTRRFSLFLSLSFLRSCFLLA